MRHYLLVAWCRAVAEIRSTDTRAYLGNMWWFIEPLLYLGAFYALFASGVRGGGAEYAAFVLCGIVPWKWFSSTVQVSANVIVNHLALLREIYLPKWVLPLSILIVTTYRFFLVFLVLALVLALLGYSPGTHWIGLALVFLSLATLILGVSCVVAALVPFVPDLKVVIDNGLLLLFFLSGIFFDINTQSPAVREWLVLNPLAQLLEMFRSVLLEGESIHSGDLLAPAVISILLLGIGSLILIGLDGLYPKLAR